MHALPLPGTLDRRAASEIARSLLDCRGGDAALDGSGVTRIRAVALEMLIAARRQWQADGHVLRVLHPSADLLAGLAALGAGPDVIGAGTGA